jgi:HSP20 family molecular chaperone IbpA
MAQHAPEENKPMTTELAAEKEQAGSDVEVTRGGHYYRPGVDILERPDELLLVADMPGSRGDEIDVHFEDGQLTIHGPTHERQPEGTRYLLNEYGVGDFCRRFRVSEQIDASRIAAEYAAGVLTVHLPKADSAKPRKIAVKNER